MVLLDQYISKAFLRYFLLSVTAFCGTYLLIDFLDKIDDFVGKSTPMTTVILYFSNSLPLFFVRVAPIAVLMASFMAIGSLSRTGEITAMRAGGLSLIRIARPLIIATLIIASGIALIQELVLPVSARTMKDIWNIQVKGEKGPQSVRDNVWYRSGNQMIFIRQALPQEGLLHDIIIFDLNDRFNIVKRSDADLAKYVDEAWKFKKAVIRKFNPDTGEVIERHSSKITSLPFSKTPEDFKHVEATLGELTFIELYHQIRQLRSEGYSTVRHQVDMHTHIASPFASLVMVLLGIPFALHRGRSASLASGIVVSVLIGVSYFIVNSVATVFGYSSILSPIIATWAANIIFMLIGIWFILFRTE